MLLFEVRTDGLLSQCMIGATCLLGTAWLRYASTAMSLSPTGAYAIMMTAQVSNFK